MNNRLDWFLNDRFGMFIHWGLYAIPARGEWVRHYEQISNEEYYKYFEEFNPVKYDPVKWAKLAKKAGMKYAVMTTKHHDGFCLFDSKYTDFKATNTKIKKDLVKEYVEAFRSEGLKVGFYYSLLDWHHEHYPVDQFHPMKNNPRYKEQKRDFSKYLEYMHSQVKELMTNYGKIDIIWFDFSYGDMSGEMWRASKLVEMVRELQPHIIINNRLGGDLRSENVPTYAGDFITPEQIIPPYPITNYKGDYVPWEACITMNNHWGYHASDKNFKSAKTLIRCLVECVSKNGNLLLNVGPNAYGEIPEESVRILEEIGDWIQKNSESIYGCGASQYPKPEWGRWTQKGNKLYAHIMEKPIGPIILPNLNGKIKKARLLSDGSEVRIIKPWNAVEYQNDAFINFDGVELPDPIDTVVELELEV